MFLEFRREVERLMKVAIETAGYPPVDLELEMTEHADLCSSVAFKLDREEKTNKIAMNIAKNIRIEDSKYISSVKVVGPYINLFVNRKFLDQTVYRILEEREEFFSLDHKGKIILEHTSANPDGPLHIGHIRNSIIGDTLARVLRKAGYEVETQYYVNDMGRQIAVLVWGLKSIKPEEKKPDHALSDVYIRANGIIEEDPEKKREADELMRKYESGDEDVVRYFEETVELCLSGIKETLEEVNIHHDRFIWESTFVRSNAVERIIEELREHAKIKDDALVLDLNGFEKEFVLQRSNGTSVYPTRDIAYHEWKAAHCERVIDILGADHKLISSQLSCILSLIGVQVPEILIFEFVSLPDGSMSSREGKFVSVDELIDEVMSHALDEVETRRKDEKNSFKMDVAKSVAVGSIRYDIVKVSPEKPTTFDWGSALDLRKKGAPFIQYAYARASSIIRKANSQYDGFNPNVLTEELEVSLIKKMAILSLIIEEVAMELKPQLVAVYARELAELFNQFYRDIPVLSAEEGLRRSRLALVECARITLRETLSMLGIEVLESM
jgi:arginyl-tRNA synthetase